MSNHRFLKLVLVFLVIFGVFCIVETLFFGHGIFDPKDSKSAEKVLFVIRKGEDLFSISDKLQKQGLIKNKIFFQFYVLLQGKRRKLKSGTYSFSPSMNVIAIAQEIFQGGKPSVEITIPEGLNLKEIEEKISCKLTEQDQEFQLKNQSIDQYKPEFSFLNNVPEGASLEGFLFPDTYFFDGDSTSEEIVRVFLKNFDEKLTPGLRIEIERQEKTIFEVITMASLLEKEVRTIEDKKMVASILWKRLESNFPLQVDATITYLTGKKTTRVSMKDLSIDSPYNTYKHLGLPIGPICNPGIESIEAAIYPKSNDYWYYLSTSEGETIFSKNLTEHNIAKVKRLD